MKLPWPEDNQKTLWLLSQFATSPSVYHTDEDFKLCLLMLKSSRKNCEYQFLLVLVWPERESNPSFLFQ